MESRLRASTGLGIPNALVATDMGPYTATTDPSGTYTLATVAAGVYTVTGNHTKWRQITLWVSLLRWPVTVSRAVSWENTQRASFKSSTRRCGRDGRTHNLMARSAGKLSLT